MDHACKLIGHRGARGLFPENTMGGFRAARALGVGWFESDVAVLKDGVVVLHHDLALNPDLVSMDGHYFNGSLPLLRSMTSDDLADYAVGRLRPGSAYAAEFPQQAAMDGERIPTLADALAFDPAVRWTLEFKLMPDRPDWTCPPDEMVQRVLDVVDAAGAADRVLLESFDWRVPRLVRRTRPDVAVGWLTRADTLADAATWLGRGAAGSVPAMIREEGGGCWGPAQEELTQAQVDEAHALGIAVMPWTVNDAGDMERLAAWGVDGMVTDYPDRAQAFAR